MVVTLRIFTVLCVVQLISGYCHFQPFDTEFCTAPTGATIPVGAELDMIEKCEKCTCSSSSDGQGVAMSCCGYGINAGVFAPPDGCKIIRGDDGCSMKVVTIQDESKSCFSV
ncbi:hypothetical protein ACF0H5_001055 [Mactra antiquata]